MTTVQRVGLALLLWSMFLVILIMVSPGTTVDTTVGILLIACLGLGTTLLVFK